MEKEKRDLEEQEEDRKKRVKEQKRSIPVGFEAFLYPFRRREDNRRRRVTGIR